MDCELCGGPVSAGSVVAVCTKTTKCRRERDRRVAAGEIPPRTCRVCGDPIDSQPLRMKKCSVCADTNKRATLLPPAYDLDDGEEIVDDTTVSIMVQGLRKVRSTQKERELAVRRMIVLGMSVGEMALHVSCTSKIIEGMLTHLGYELIDDKMQSYQPHRQVIVPVDREKRKTLAPGDGAIVDVAPGARNKRSRVLV